MSPEGGWDLGGSTQAASSLVQAFHVAKGRKIGQLSCPAATRGATRAQYLDLEEVTWAIGPSNGWRAMLGQRAMAAERCDGWLQSQQTDSRGV